MKIRMTVTVETEPIRWGYDNATPTELRGDVRSYVDNLLRHCGAAEQDDWSVVAVKVAAPRQSPAGPR